MKYCKHGVDRTGGKYVNRSAGKNADMYAYKGGADRWCCERGAWMRASVSEQGVGQERASASERHTIQTSGHQRPQARERERPTVEPPCERASASGKGGGTGRE